jgi:transcriptional regulator with XRE-family HTH domain
MDSGMAATLDSSGLALRIAREIRAHREARGLSLNATAERAGLSKTIVARIESGAGNPSLETLARIARALDVTVGTLLAEDEPISSELIRRSDGELMAYESGIRGRVLHVDGRDRRSEIIELHLAPGTRYSSEAHAPGTEELVIALQGSVRVGPEGHEERLDEGDALRFAADVRHVYQADKGCLALCCFSYPGVRHHRPGEDL